MDPDRDTPLEKTTPPQPPREEPSHVFAALLIACGIVGGFVATVYFLGVLFERAN